VLPQHPDIESLMHKLCKELSKCLVEDSEEVTALFSEKLELAKFQQERLGHKATYRNVEYDFEDE
jgi:hypothetical protein